MPSKRDTQENNHVIKGRNVLEVISLGKIIEF